eukprot:Nitzschia sp. Nitz4//scaffold123_size70294//68281//68820//NITZ4_005936-RA/size70294-processed-gene-0.29-mRNA-1//-1//CDS//3329534509//1971//frame0
MSSAPLLSKGHPTSPPSTAASFLSNLPSTAVILGTLRIVGGLGLLGGVILFGFYASPVWVLPCLAFIFTITFGMGRWRAWQYAARHNKLGKAVAGQLGTFVCQLVLVTIFYFMGRGIEVTLPKEYAVNSAPFYWLVIFAFYAFAFGGIIVVLEYRSTEALLQEADDLALYGDDGMTEEP